MKIEHKDEDNGTKKGMLINLGARELLIQISQNSGGN